MADASPENGINLVGYFAGDIGLTHTARLVGRAIERAGIPHRPFVNRDWGHPSVETEADEPEGAPPYDTNLICCNGDVLPGFAQRVGREFFDGRRNIGLWYCETDSIPPAYHAGFPYLDEIWTNSTFVRDAVARDAPFPVRSFPHPLDLGDPGDPSLLERYELGDRFVFLFVFDIRSALVRKNPDGVVRSFLRAFPEETPGGPLLVLKSLGGEICPVDLGFVKSVARGRSDIRFIDGYVPHAEKTALMNRCDCYVSLHRAEGLGQTLLEAMALGKPCIGTAYSGNLDFMTDANSYLCPAESVPVGPGTRLYPPWFLWADPNLDAAARIMREVMAHPEEAAARGARAKAEITATHSIDCVSRAVAKLFEDPAPLREERRPDLLFQSNHEERARTLMRRDLFREKLKKFEPSGRHFERIFPQLQELLEAYDKHNSRVISATLTSAREERDILAERVAVLEDKNHRLEQIAEVLIAAHLSPKKETDRDPAPERDSISAPPGPGDRLNELRRKIARLADHDPVTGELNIDGNVRGMPRPYLDAAIHLLNAIGGKTVVEIGSMRRPIDHHPDFIDRRCCNDGHSTWFWARAGFDVISVDIDPEATEVARTACRDFDNCTVVTGDGLAFLEKNPDPIDLLYLDGWDVIPDTPYAENHLAAYRAAQKQLSPDNIIVIDDTDIADGGKGRLLLPVLAKDGYEILVQGRQTIALKKPQSSGIRATDAARALRESIRRGGLAKSS